MGRQRKGLMWVSDEGWGAAINLNIGDPFLPAGSQIFWRLILYLFSLFIVEMDVEVSHGGK